MCIPPIIAESTFHLVFVFATRPSYDRQGCCGRVARSHDLGEFAFWPIPASSSCFQKGCGERLRSCLCIIYLTNRFSHQIVWPYAIN
jgi:hypothetical protein